MAKNAINVTTEKFGGGGKNSTPKIKGATSEVRDERTSYIQEELSTKTNAVSASGLDCRAALAGNGAGAGSNDCASTRQYKAESRADSNHGIIARQPSLQKARQSGYKTYHKKSTSPKRGILAFVAILFTLMLGACSAFSIPFSTENGIGLTPSGEIDLSGGAKSAIPLTEAQMEANMKSGVSQTWSSSGAFTFEAKAGYIYKLEVWGAQGGSVPVTGGGASPIGGKGGYSKGFWDNSMGTTTTLNISVGGKGGDATKGAGGGGASDVRIGGVALANRIIVGGGGGGAGTGGQANEDSGGGYGGGTTGGAPINGSGVNNSGGTYTPAAGGSQNAGGVGSSYSSSKALNGALGIGGGATSVSMGIDRGSVSAPLSTSGAGGWNGGAAGPASQDGAGGGGGYYGGGAGWVDGNAAGGGSGYIANTLVYTSTSSGTKSGNGQVTITEYYGTYNPLNPTLTVNRGAAASWTDMNLIATNPSQTSVKYQVNNTSTVYLDASGTSANAYFSNIALTATSISLTPKFTFGSMTFYVQVKHPNFAPVFYAPIRITSNNPNNWVQQGSGAVSGARFGSSTTATAPGDSPGAGVIYNPNGESRLTLFYEQPVVLTDSKTITATDLFKDADTAFDSVVIQAASASNSGITLANTAGTVYNTATKFTTTSSLVSGNYYVITLTVRNYETAVRPRTQNDGLGTFDSSVNRVYYNTTTVEVVFRYIVGYTLKSPPLSGARGASLSLTNTNTAVNAENTSQGLNFATHNAVYTDQSGATSAVGTYFTSVSGSATALTLVPKVALTNKQFFARMQHPVYTGVYVYAPFTVSTTNNAWVQKAGHNSGLGVTLGNSTSSGATAPPVIDTSTIYNPNGNGRLTFFKTTPIGATSSFTFSATDLYTDNDTAYDKVFFGLANNVDKAAYTMNYSSPAGTDLDKGVYMGNSTITITPKTTSASNTYFVETVTLYNFENTQRPENANPLVTGATYNAQANRIYFSAIDVDIVFKLDNTRPYYVSHTSYPGGAKAEPIAKVKAGTSQTFNLANIVTDIDSNNLTFKAFKVPQNEYLPLDKYGSIITLTNSGYYNGPSAAGNKVDGANGTILTAEGSSALATTFNTAIAGTSEAPGTYVNVDVTGTLVTITGVRATKNMYSPTRGATQNLGHFYILVQIEDSGEVADKGIWYPIAIEVQDTAPIANTNPSKPIVEGTMGDSAAATVIVPFGISAAGKDYGVGAPITLGTEADVSKMENNSYQFLSRDADNFILSKNTDKNPLARPMNDPTLIARTQHNIDLIANQASPGSNFGEFFKVELIRVRVAANIFAEFDVSTLIGTDNYLRPVAGSPELYEIEALKVTPLKSSNNLYIEFEAEVISVTDLLKTTGQNPQVKSKVLVLSKNSGPTIRMASEIGNTLAKSYNPIGSIDGSIYKFEMKRGETLYISVYDLFADADVSEAVTRANSNPKDGGEFTAAGQEVKAAKTVMTATAPGETNLTSTQLQRDRLTIKSAGEGTRTDIAKVKVVGEVDIPYLQISGEARVDGVYTEFEFAVGDVDGKEASVKIRIEVINSLPTLNSNLFADGKPKVFKLTAGNKTNSSDVENGALNTGATYNVREFSMYELLADVDVTDVDNLGIVSGSIDYYTRDAVDGEYVLIRDAIGGVGFADATLAKGTGLKIAETTVLRIEGRSSTQGLKYGFFVGFKATDTKGTIELYIQIEVMESAPVMNAEEFNPHLNGEGKVDYYEWTLAAARNTQVSDRFLVSSEEMGRRLTSDDTLYKVVGHEPDTNQRLIPYAPYRPTATALPQVKKSFVTSFNQPQEEIPYIAVMMKDPFSKDGEIDRSFGDILSGDILSLEWYERGLLGTTPVDVSGKTYKDVQNYDWAVRIKYDRSSSFGSADAVHVWLSLASSSEVYSELYGSEGGQSYDTASHGYEGLRTGTPTVGLIANFQTHINLIKGSLGLINNFEYYPKDGENGRKYGALDDLGNLHSNKETDSDAKDFWYDNITVPSGGSSVAVPLSYFATTTLTDSAPGNAEMSIGYASVYGKSSDFNEIAKSITITDNFGGSWSGNVTDDPNRLNNNPYVTVGIANAQSFIETVSPYENLPRAVYNAITTSEVGTISMSKGAFQEDRVGLIFTKGTGKIRTGADVNITVDLLPYNSSGEKGASGTYTLPAKGALPISVKVPLIVENSELNVKASDNYQVVSMKTGDPKSPLIYTINDGGTAPSYNTEKYNLKAVEYQDEDAPSTVYNKDSRYRDTAYFSHKSISNTFSEADRAYVTDALRKGSKLAKQSVLDYFGMNAGASEVDMLAKLNGGYNPNPGYKDYFSIDITDYDSTAMVITPIRKTALNVSMLYELQDDLRTATGKTTAELPEIPEQTDSTPAATLKEYAKLFNLDYETGTGFYYPFKVMLYDDNNGSGLLKGSVDVLILKIAIGNSAPKVNSSAVDAYGKMTLQVTTGGIPPSRMLSALFSDRDMLENKDVSGRPYYTESEIKAWAPATAVADSFGANQTNYLKVLTTDYIKDEVKVEHISGDGAAVTCEIGYKLDKKEPIQIMFNVNTRNLDNPKTTYKITIADSTGAPSSIEVVIEVTNKKPEEDKIARGANTVSSNAVSNITMRTGDYFYLLVTDFANIEELSSYAQGSAFYRAATGTGSLEHEKFAGNQWFGSYANIMKTAQGFIENTTDDVKYANQSNVLMGFLPVFTDDTPWNLRFTASTPTLNQNPAITVSSGYELYPEGKHTTQNRVATVLRITAAGSCSSVPITVTAFDENASLQTSATFRITVISTPPKAITQNDIDNNNLKLGEGLSITKETPPDKNWYNLTLNYGESREFKMSDFAFDRDIGESAKMRLMNVDTIEAFQMSYGEYDNVKGLSGMIHTAQTKEVRLTKNTNTNTFTVNAIDITNSGKDPVTAITFVILDAGATGGAAQLTITVFVRIRLSQPTKGVAGIPLLEVKSAAVFNTEDSSLSRLEVVGRTSGLFRDADISASSSAYNVNMYLLMDADGKVISANTFTSSGFDKSEYRILSSENGTVTTYDNDTVWKYLDRSNASGIYGIDDIKRGSTFGFAPIMATPSIANGGLPMYIELIKAVTDRTLGEDSVTVNPVGSELTLKVTNSKPTANESQRGNEIDEKPFLEFHGVRSESREYKALTKDGDQRSLYSDMDANDTVIITSVTLKKAYKINNKDEEYIYMNPSELLQVGGMDAVSIGYKPTQGAATSVTFAINFKVDPPDAFRGYPMRLDYEVTGRDTANNTVSNTVTVVISNSEPTFVVPLKEDGTSKLPGNVVAHEVDKRLTGLDIYLEQGATYDLKLADIYVDKDYDLTRPAISDKASFVSKTDGRKYYSEISGDAGKTNFMFGGNLFRAQVMHSDNSVIRFTAMSPNRGEVLETVLIIEDTGGASTLYTSGELLIRLIIDNTRPGAVDNTSIYIVGGKKAEDGSESGLRAKYTFNVLDYLKDPNPQDMKPATVENLLYIRPSHAPELLPLDGRDDICEVTADGQTIIIRPKAGADGTQRLSIRVTDGPVAGDEYRTKSFELMLDIHITKDPAELTAYGLEIQKKLTKDITVQDLFGSEDGEGFVIVDMKQPQSDAVTVSERIVGGKTVYSVKANDEHSKTNITTKIAVIGQESEEFESFWKPVEFEVENIENSPPELTAEYRGVNKVFEITDPNKTIKVKLSEIVKDSETDVVSIVSVVSKKTAVVKVYADTAAQTITFAFEGRGNAEILLEVTDLSEELVPLSFTVENFNLAPLNFFAAMIGHIQTNPMLYIIIAAVILFLILLLIIIIAAIRRKRRMRDEIEALLVSEMELEEQMLRLAASPSPTFYQSYGYLSPTQNVQQNPSFMLGEGRAYNPGQANPNVIGLNAGQSETPNPTISLGLESFPEDDL